ncbi:hypothetical protein MAE02_46810 [Microvirga aerophila]|uniref:Uncharacterized protein n=1 Tax=Microvirga aerophila TaxID=670291 RepID=A0A512BYF4_9HYPH|nr:hypothetical protein MAE02_46810 [Microvirga aerophila]
MVGEPIVAGLCAQLIEGTDRHERHRGEKIKMTSGYHTAEPILETVTGCVDWAPPDAANHG